MAAPRAAVKAAPMRPNQLCFSNFGTPTSSVTQGRAERHQFCRFGGN
jgi:hypothetical protein